MKPASFTHEDLESVFHQVCNHSETLVIICNANCTITYINAVAETVLGYTTDEVVGKSPLMLHLTEEWLDRTKNSTSEKVADNINFCDELTVLSQKEDEWHFVRKDGRRVLVSISTSRQITNGDLKGYLILANDITEKKKPEMELRAALQKEKELNELKSRFVSMASHEFRTPLGAVLSSAYLVSRYKKEDQQAQREKHIDQIVSSVNTLTEILNDFLSVGKIEEGEIHPNFVIFDIRDHTNSMIREVSHLLKQYQRINYQHVGEKTSVLLDPSMLKHVVINLLSNAIKFSTDESTIDVYTERTEDYLTISVKDYGIGIPDEEQRSLFKIFFRSSFATNIQGTGLGLYIVKKYVEIMGGTISFKSEIGEGTEFVIKFNISDI